jgi:pimeloyl-ACP methyl ester carboxylesterase
MGTWIPRRAPALVAAVLPLLATSAREPAGEAPLRAFTIRAGDLTLRAVRAGHGPPIVLLHGYGETLLAWREVFSTLAHAGDVIAFDLPGSGLSSKPNSGYTAESLAATVVRALGALRVQRATLVGHSLGGAVAAAVALDRPDLVDGLVLIDPAVTAVPWPVVLARMDSGPALRRAIAGYEALRADLAGVHDPQWISEDDSALAYDPAADPAYHAALLAILREFDFTVLTHEQAERLRLPVLVLWGEFDPVIPLAAGRRLAASLPDARLDVIGRSWHRPHEERPAAVAARILAFMKLLAGRRQGSPH